MKSHKDVNIEKIEGLNRCHRHSHRHNGIISRWQSYQKPSTIHV